ncbi:uncharacterized protein LOC574954 [Strongylocentrotus purpuratus]|uniref:Uncharacterized protein n=1 Tax=Strongylocentrotus purpuratus TaxID=7668 RepID=A0A7M7HQ92_STRPU|nr:uncharacterized protein LOC574954 [Strongylocentrotus purpuratus]
MRAFIAFLLVAVASANLAPLLTHIEPIPGKYIIKLKDGINVDEISATVRLSGGRVRNIYRHALNGFAADLSDRVLDAVRTLDAVEYVEQEGVYRATAVESWGLDRIDQASLPLNDQYNPSGTGSGWSVYVIDTGVMASHNDFVARRTSQLVNYAGDGEDEDCNGHGTHCAGTVGSQTYGVATGVNIYGVKVLNCAGSGSTAGVIAGVEYVQANAPGNSVASMSLGGGPSSSLDDAVNSLVSSGVPCAVAAGNSDINACFASPARAELATTVGSTNRLDSRSSFSNWGTCVDIFAPGTSITSTWIGSDSATNTISGTSMACPHVAGALALYGKSTDGDLIAAGTQNALSDVGTGSPNILLRV